MEGLHLLCVDVTPIAHTPGAVDEWADSVSPLPPGVNGLAFKVIPAREPENSGFHYCKCLQSEGSVVL